MPDPAHLWMAYALALLAALYARASLHPRSSQSLLRISIAASLLALGLGTLSFAGLSTSVPWVITSLLSIVILAASLLCLHYLHLLRRLYPRRRRLAARLAASGGPQPSGMRA